MKLFKKSKKKSVPAAQLIKNIDDIFAAGKAAPQEPVAKGVTVLHKQQHIIKIYDEQQII